MLCIHGYIFIVINNIILMYRGTVSFYVHEITEAYSGQSEENILRF